MDGTWWRQRHELDADQQSIISLPIDGRYLIVGPPGSGKTNLLVLRAAFLAKTGYVDQMFLTFGGVLSAFIATGSKEIKNDQISTFARWARRLAVNRNPGFSDRLKAAGSGLDKPQRFLAERALVSSECLTAIHATGYSANIHQAIQVDEVQDLSREELLCVVAGASRISIAGDSRQSIYHGNAIEHAKSLGFNVHVLVNHYRIGKAVARVADRLYPPDSPSDALEATTLYDETSKQSRAEYRQYPTRRAQFDAMAAELRAQLRAYPGEALAVFIARRRSFEELRDFFYGTDLYANAVFHEQADVVNFTSGARIHILTVAGAKGSEFRAVHLFGCEDAQGPQDTAEFWYTAVTRAKTTLLAYASHGTVSRKLQAAFAINQEPSIDSLFE